MTNKTYQIIYADPPWAYSNFQGKGSYYGDVSRHYKTMPKEQIENLNVELIADENCILFLWATFPNLPQAIKLIKVWGFEYKTVGFVWVKMKNDMSEPRGDGMGFYTLSNAEIVLIGIKGKFKRNRKDVKQIVLSPKWVHSKKPDEIKKRITDLCGDLPRIELFARQKTKGWDVWGNEVESDIKL
jgi:site-specific DNA-methyltransferase (adenine-specific)